MACPIPSPVESATMSTCKAVVLAARVTRRAGAAPLRHGHNLRESLKAPAGALLTERLTRFSEGVRARPPARTIIHMGARTNHG